MNRLERAVRAWAAAGLENDFIDERSGDLPGRHPKYPAQPDD